jgi:ligand-binding SRPBCC domain-containing protein
MQAMLEIARHVAAGTVVRTQVVVPRPLEETFAFFADARNLEAITPPLLGFEIVDAPARETQLHDLIDYRLRLRGLPMRWRTRIAAWEPPHRFVDEQLRGPYAWWIHEHTFEADGADATIMRDEVWYRPRGGPLVARLVDRAFVQRDVAEIFRWREQRLLELLANA